MIVRVFLLFCNQGLALLATTVTLSNRPSTLVTSSLPPSLTYHYDKYQYCIITTGLDFQIENRNQNSSR